MTFAALLRPLAGIALMVALAGCSTAPFKVEGSDEATVGASVQAVNVLPRLRPYAFGLCYSPMFNEDPEIYEEAAYECDGGSLVRMDEDFFWNGCSLRQPHRQNFVCFPPDKLKRRPTAEVVPNN